MLELKHELSLSVDKQSHEWIENGSVTSDNKSNLTG